MGDSKNPGDRATDREVSPIIISVGPNIFRVLDKKNKNPFD